MLISRGCRKKWPYKFVTQLLARTMERNPALNLQTETPVLGVEYTPAGEDGQPETILRTARGSVRAKKVIFATNGYTAELLPQYKGILTPYKGTAAHLAPSPAKGPVFPHLSHTYNLEFGIDDRETTDYLNPRPDGGIVVGGGKWLYQDQRDLWFDTVDDSTTFDAIADAGYFEGYMQRNFRGWEDSETQVDKIWRTRLVPMTGMEGLAEPQPVRPPGRIDREVARVTRQFGVGVVGSVLSGNRLVLTLDGEPQIGDAPYKHVGPHWESLDPGNPVSLVSQKTPDFDDRVAGA